MSAEATLQKAWYTITQLKQVLKKQESRLSQPIAIVGLACRFPGAMNKDAYWDLLTAGKNMITPLPDARWQLLNDTDECYQRDHQHPYYGGFLNDITAFDAYFFGISPREAVHMDPQQRLLLEVTYEAIEDAGIATETLTGSNTGVFTSLYTNQFGFQQPLEDDLDALFIPTGNATSIAANRLSYLFDLRGPSLVIDTACSSSLVALHTAALSLQTGQCDRAIVCAANLNVFPSTNKILARAKMLSPDGQCKTFDANANGYVQGEGVGAIILKPLAQALADKDRVYAVVQSSGINQDGRTNGLTAPNGLQQEKLIKSIYTKANIHPHHVSYIECHGTGTYLGDPIEIQALGEAIGKQRPADQPCWIGSVKTNVGHLEPAAGMASVIKVALALQHAKIPPHLNVSEVNPLLNLDKYHLQIPTRLEEWPRYGDYRLAGISGFGFGGTNAHVLLREIVPAEQPELVPAADNSSELFTLSAKDPHALNAMVATWITYLAANPEVSLAQLCHLAHVRRSHYFFRMAIIADSTAALLTTLQNLQQDKSLTTGIVFTTDEKNKAVPHSAIPKNLHELPLTELATLYINQANINWSQFEENRHYPMMDLPRYPWQHKAYWPQLGKQTTERDDRVLSRYPFQGRALASPLSTRQYEFKFNTRLVPEILDTNNVLHAGYYLEMMAFAMQDLGQQHAFQIEQLQFLSPIFVPEGQTIQIHLLLEKTADETRWSCQYYSRGDQQGDWKKHASGQVTLSTQAVTGLPTIDDIKQRSQQFHESDVFYARVRALDMPADGSIRWTHHFWRGENEILCKLEMPTAITTQTAYQLPQHFSIIDACIQGLFLVIPEQFNNPYVAGQMGQLTWHGKNGQSLYLYAKLNTLQDDQSEYRGDWFLLNDNNEVLAECHDLCMKRLTTTLKLSQIKQSAAHVADWATLSNEQRKSKITDYLREQVAHIFSMPVDDVDILRSVNDMGMDSLMAIVLMRAIETGLGVSYTMQALLQGPSIADITDHVLTDMQKRHATQTTTATPVKRTTPWIGYRQTPATPTMRLFCFPYGGGGASIYRNWSKSLPDTLDVCPIQLPGREDRLDETPVRQFDNLIDTLLQQLEPELDLPFAFFGHSFGSLLAFELTRHLRRRHLPMPSHLFASAYPDPRTPTASLQHLITELQQVGVNLFDFDNQKALAALNADQLNTIIDIFTQRGLNEYGALAMNTDAIKLLLPIFIGDMSIVNSYRYQEEAPLAVPLTVFLGQEDKWVLPAEVAGWSAHTSQDCTFYELPSGHMYIKETDHLQEMLQRITRVLQPETEILAE